MKYLIYNLAFCLSLFGAGNGFRNGYDNEARAWRGQVVTQSGTLTTNSYPAALWYIQHAKQWGFRQSLQRVNLYLGADKNALEAIIIHDIGTTTDSLVGKASFTYSETGGLAGLYNGGVAGGGTTCINPGINTSSLQTNSCHYALYNLTPTNETSSGMGGYTGSFNPIGFLDIGNGGNSRGFMWGNPGGIIVADSNGTGFYSVSRVSSTSLTLYKNGSSIGTDTTASGGTPQPIIVHAVNNAGDIAFETSRAFCYYAVGLGLSSSQEAIYYKLVQHTQIIAHRAVGSTNL